MAHKPIYAELEERVKESEKEVAEHRHVEATLETSIKKYSSLVENLPDMIYILDSEGYFRFVGGAVKELFGFTAEELTGKHFTSIIWPEDLGKAKWRFNERRIGERSTKGFEVRLTTKNGEKKDCDVKYLPFELYASGVYDKPVSARDKKLLATCGVARDITERKRAENRLKESRQQLRNLSEHLQTAREQERAIVAREIHDDLGQTLTALRLDFHWLKDNLSKEEETLIEKIESMTKLLDMTIQSVRNLYSELRPFVLDDLGLVAAIEWMAQRFQNRTGIECQLTLSPGDMVPNKDDEITVFRIFQEALTNVGLHANATKVKVGLEERAGTLTLSVSDDGKGITEQEICHPESFGLIGVQERAHALGGSLKISGIPGEGTTFTLSITARELSPCPQTFCL
jgi:PAS domain S-box-containing protein